MSQDLFDKKLSIICETSVGWLPAREKDAEANSFKAVLQAERSFVEKPTPSEQVRIFGEFFTVTNFFHDTDAQRLQVCLRPEWAHSPEQAKARIADLEQKGWVKQA